MDTKDFKNISIKSGNIFYEKSKLPKDGFAQVTSKTGVVSFHKEYPFIEGKLIKVVKKDTEWGECLEVFLDCGDHIKRFFQFLFNQKQQLQTWAIELSKYLPGLKLGSNIKISLNKTSLNAKGIPYENMYVEQDGEKLGWAYTINDLPKLEKKENKITKVVTWDSTARDEYVYPIIEKAIANLKGQSQKEHTKDYNVDKGSVVIESKPTDLPF